MCHKWPCGAMPSDGAESNLSVCLSRGLTVPLCLDNGLIGSDFEGVLLWKFHPISNETRF